MSSEKCQACEVSNRQLRMMEERVRVLRELLVKAIPPPVIQLAKSGSVNALTAKLAAMTAERDALRERCERYQKALEFYAEPNSWRPEWNEWEGQATPHAPEAHTDKGDKARAALQPDATTDERRRLEREKLERWQTLLMFTAKKVPGSNATDVVAHEINTLLEDDTITLKQCVDFLWRFGYRLRVTATPLDPDKEDADA
jgi:hypothetical protein